MNEWAKTGDKGKPQPDGFTPEGGLVRVHYDQDNVEDCNDDDGDDDQDNVEDCNDDDGDDVNDEDDDDDDIFCRARNLAWRSSMASGTTPLVTTGAQCSIVADYDFEEDDEDDDGYEDDKDDNEDDTLS